MPRPPSEDDMRRTYAETIDELYGFVARRCDGDRDLAEDVTQETWFRAVRAWRVHGLPERPLGWLATVAARVLSDLRRRPPAQSLDAETPTAPTTPDEGDERLPFLRRALAALPYGPAHLLRAFHYDARAVADIAREAGLSERAVEGRLRRARESLRRAIETQLADRGHSYE